MRNPPTMAVQRPWAGVHPEAMAKPMARGRAMKPTVSPAPTSARKERRS